MSRRAQLVAVGMTALVVGSAFVTANLLGITVPADPPAQDDLPYVRLYDAPSNELEVMLNQGDGQAFAALAMDPTLDRPEVFRGGAAEAAYRAQRPMLGWLAWAGSLGRPSLVPTALAVWSVIGFAALAVVSAAMLRADGTGPWWGLAIALSPGSLITLDWTGPDALGAALVLAGVAAWSHGDVRLAALALTLGGLTRETLLLVPVALLLHVWTRGGDRRASRLLLVPGAVYAAWLLVVRARLDAWPSDAGSGRLGVPFAGLLDAISGWESADAAVALLLLALALGALALRPGTPAAWVAVGYLAASAWFGQEVWARFEDFSRVLLPLVAFGAVTFLPPLMQRRTARLGEGSTTAPNMRS